MKRQLADRARQAEALEKQLQLEQQKLELLRHHGNDLADVVVTNAKEFQIDRKSRTIQFPSSTDPIRSASATATAIESTGGDTARNHSTPTTPKSGTTATGTNQNVEGTATSVSSSTTSSNSSATLENRNSIKRDTPSSLQDAVVSENIPSSPSVSKEEIQLQRPTKIPKLNHYKVRNSPLNHDTAQTSSSTVIEGKGDHAGGSTADVVNRSTTTNSSQPLPVPSSSSSRRLSLEPPSATTNDSSGNTHTPSDDNESSQQSAFYLKHQNRALATELKSYQYSMSELLQERTIRRSHCFRIFQTVQQLIHIWNTIENEIVSTSDIPIQRNNINDVTSSDTANMDNASVPVAMDHIIASTGTDDSIEWTRALLKALNDLGRCALPIEPDSSRRAVSQDATMENTTSYGDVLTSSSTPASANTDYPKYTEEIVANISSRAKILQDWLRAGLEKQRPGSDNDDMLDEKSSHDNSAAAVQHQNEISDLLTRCATLESQITELVTCRTDLIQRERRLRRNIYRMASNLITPEQVVNSAMMRPEDTMADNNNEVDDIETAVHLEKQELLRLQNEHQELLQTINATKSLQSSHTSNHGDSTATDLFNAYTETPHFSHLRSKQIEEYQIKITQLEESVAVANESIQQLNVLLKEKEDEITLLSQRQLSDDDRLKLESIPSTILQLQQSQQQNIELQTRLKTTEQMWSQTLSNEKAAMQSVSDLVQKFNKRWAELTNTANTEPDGSTATIRTMATTDSNADSNVASLVTTEKTNEHPHIRMSKQILELQHKLQQAMENVQQAELSRENLKMALSMNTTLQGKLDEMKGKYTALQNARSSGTSSTTKTVASSKDSATGDNESKNGVSSTVEDVLLQEASSDGNVNTNSKASQNDLSPTPILRKEKVAPSKSKVTDTTSSANRTSTSSSSEKLQREYRKVRKELTAMTTNHTSMMTANVRLLKQITEKDEMNAKSLSTILHLKSTTEKLIEERDHLEIQMKNASQLALAARLATNAKDRVSEELLKEKNNLDERRIALEEQLLSTQAELNRISVEWTNASSIIATKDTELLNMKQRCNRLVEENERYRDEIRQLKNAVSQAERDAREKTEKLTEVMAKVSKDGDYNVGTNGAVSSSSFTVEQLQTQVSVLKNRLACPVCHYRDKECIIIRCRHMHCKQCVDERVSNRSRKCPTCNVKFAENEVETIFLS